VQRTPVHQVEREDARVAVSLAQQAAEAHQLDQQLVLREAVRAGRELVRRRLKHRLRRRVEGIGVSGPDSLHQQAHVVRCGRRRWMRRTARPGCDDHCPSENRQQDASHHEADFSTTKITTPRLKR
jgi:hypothetical protein